MKLSAWAKLKGLSYRGAYEMFRRGALPGATQLPSGTILVDDTAHNSTAMPRIVIYCRVSSRDQKDDLTRQITRTAAYCAAKGWSVDKVYSEIASGMNDSRKQLLAMLDSNPTIIVVENKDRLTRFGFNYLDVLLAKQGCTIEVMHKDTADETDLIKDMIAVVTSFCCRLYGSRRGSSKAKAALEVVTPEQN